MGTTTSVNFGAREPKIVTLSAARTVLAEETGTTFILDGTVGAAITLPALANGLNFRFIVGSTFITSDWVISSSEGDNINGILLVNGASVPAAAEDNITFELAAEAVGDYVEFIADSGNSQWIVNGVGASASSMSANDPA